MRFYNLLTTAGRPKSYLGKILVVSFCGVHVPLLALVAYLLAASPLPLAQTLPILLVILAATLVGTGLTLFLTYSLLAPVRQASRALRVYLRDKQIPALPTHAPDEAGRLMADVQEAVTRLDRAIDAAYAARDQAVEDKQTKFELLSKMSHELRTPLNAIIGFSEIMQNELLGPLGGNNYVDYAADIRSSGVNLLSLVQSVLELSQLEAGHYRGSDEVVPLAPIVEQVVGLAHFPASQSGVDLSLAMAPGLPAVVADARAMKQVLSQLVQIGLQSTRPGGTVRLSLTREQDNVSISVTDTGKPFDRDDVPALLGQAVRSGGTAIETSAGAIGSVSTTGLTLSVIYSLVHLNGGTMRLGNVAGGKEITVSLPAAANQSAAPLAA